MESLSAKELKALFVPITQEEFQLRLAKVACETMERDLIEKFSRICKPDFIDTLSYSLFLYTPFHSCMSHIPGMIGRVDA